MGFYSGGCGGVLGEAQTAGLAFFQLPARCRILSRGSFGCLRRLSGPIFEIKFQARYPGYLKAVRLDFGVCF